MPAVLQRRAGLPQLVLLLAGSCLSVLGAVLIAPVLPQMTDHFAGVPGADVLVPIVLTVPALIIGLTAPFAGFIADRIDRKRVLIIAMVGYSIFGTAPLYLDTLGSIIGSRVLVGLCEAAIMTCCTTLIADYWSGPRRSRYLGLQTLLASVSATVFLGVGGALGSSGWRTPFWLYLAAVALAVPMALFIWQPPATGADARDLPPIPWRRLRVPCLVTLAGGVVFYALIVELSFVLDEAGVTATATIGALSALMSLATAIAAGSFAKLSGRTPRELLPVAFGLAAAGFLVIWSSGSVAVITVGAVITGAGTGLLLPVLVTWATNGLTFAERGRGTGLWTGTLFVGQFLSPVLITGLSGAVGGLRPALGVLGILTAVLAAGSLALVPRSAPALNVTHD
ncbi:MFS transporter [Actinoplanes italicus]|uniref:Putative MFS family arabinose efflux permease n=1 Tax=Actinoplanes italicus TaxID=113567 RepID=A0A2T0K0R3_9ACTN|nr:MFS transporter [Actinoplanes italicus]PRX16379.1 putative MFS family arabinose efflux permease [Actinoplanes italicus]GIE34456.1 MFS transporter [Actinoplanes italicus]